MKMNCLHATALALGLAFTITGRAFSQSLVNPDFSEEGAESHIAAGWETVGEWMRREPSWYPKPASGEVMGYHHYRIQNSEVSGFFQDVADVKAGQTVRFAILIMADEFNPDLQGPQKVELKLEAGAEGLRETVASMEIPLEEIPMDNQWHEFAIDGVMPQDGLRVSVTVTPSESAPRSSSLKFAEAYLEAGQ